MSLPETEAVEGRHGAPSGAPLLVTKICFSKESPVEKKAKKKPLFLMKETLVHLSLDQRQVQGGICIGISEFDLSDYSKCVVVK